MFRSTELLSFPTSWLIVSEYFLEVTTFFLLLEFSSQITELLNFNSILNFFENLSVMDL